MTARGASSDHRPPHRLKVRAPSVLMALAGCLVVVLVMRFDYVVLGLTPLHENTYPNGTPIYLARSAAFAVAALLGLGALLRLPQRCEVVADSEPWPWARICVIAAAIMTLGSVAIFVADPYRYHVLSLEDHVVETLSAVFALEAALILAVVAIQLVRTHGNAAMTRLLMLVGLAGACFVLGMEEISWGQRFLDLETPDAIRELNPRNEINFHNMQTAFFEFAYYFGLFLFFIVAPVAHARTRVFERLGPAGDFVPTWTAALVAAPAFGYNYVFWNLAFTQVAFWFTLAFLVWHMNRLRRERAWATLGAAGAAFVAFAGSQYVFFARGEMFLSIRLWDATEYKELILPFALMVYAIVIAERFRRTGGLSVESRTDPPLVVESRAFVPAVSDRAA